MGPIVDSMLAFEDKVWGGSVRITFTAESCGEGIHLEAAQECPQASQAQYLGCGEVLLLYSATVGLSKVSARVVVSGPYEVELIPLTNMNGVVPSAVSYGMGDYPLIVIYSTPLNVPLLPFEAPV